MKITCPYCGTLYNDTKTHCPSCGAVNDAVVRTSGGQPITIEELKQWYKDRGLPPYETTRFFIGENYKGKRAFGIYHDKKTGNYIVYKNKDNGQRAIRYEGTDEAYAVNELYQRLKQEIIQQKRLNVEKSKNSGKTKVPASGKRNRLSGKRIGKFLARLIGIPLGIFFVIFVIAFIYVLIEDAPKDGYYDYQQSMYYHYNHSQPSGMTDWFVYDEAGQEWTGPVAKEALPKSLKKNKNASTYFLSEETPVSMEKHSFTDSVVYADARDSYTIEKGYYQYDDITYYHLESDRDDGWYYYDTSDTSWYESDETDVPDDLKHSALAVDFYYTPTWDSETQITDFTDTTYYSNYVDSQKKESSWDDDDDDDYNWDSNDSWDSGGSDWDSDW